MVDFLHTFNAFYWFISHLFRSLRDKSHFYNPFSILEIIIFFVIFFIGAIGEEIGWSGFIKKPMIKKYGALKAGLGIGFVWAIWHFIPYIQMNKAISWIIIQSICTILQRIIMVWLFQNNNQSLFLMSLFHSMVNISPYLFSKSQVNYESIIFLGTLLILSLVLIGFYEPRRFIGFRKLKF